MNTHALRTHCAVKLATAAKRAARLHAFVGLDGFVDEIFHVVDKRTDAEHYQRLRLMTQWGDRIRAAAGKSTNIELVSKMVKLGGNGPIMANALARLGLRVSYLGNLGHPNLHPVFADFAECADVASIAEPGYTEAIEFEDGKVMLGKHKSLCDVNWMNICDRFGRDKLAATFSASHFIAFVNWTMLTAMSDIWGHILDDICPGLCGGRRTLFFDLADPEKRNHDDVLGALALVSKFQRFGDVTLGFNEKEACEIGSHLDFEVADRSPEGLVQLATRIRDHVAVRTVVVHPVTFAVAVSEADSAIVEGPFTPQPRITTGAGDHFNAGFCLGKLLGFDNATALLAGVTTSGLYVRTAQSPAIADLVTMLGDWPTK